MYLYSVVTILCLEEAFNKSEILLVKKLEETSENLSHLLLVLHQI